MISFIGDDQKRKLYFFLILQNNALDFCLFQIESRIILFHSQKHRILSGAIILDIASFSLPFSNDK